MVTLIKYGALSGGEKYNVNVMELDGLSTDTKPNGIYIEYGSDGREIARMAIPNGSVFIEVDTGKTYMYNATGGDWSEVSIGGGGGSSDAYATAISLTIDNSTYVMTAQLLNKDGNPIGSAQTIDLPLESMVVSGSYNAQTKKIILTLKNGQTVEFSVADLVDGLESSAHAASTYQTQAGMSAYETSAHAAQTYQPIGSYATTSDIADMATETWVSQQGFETSAHAANTYQTQTGMSNYATRADITNMQTTTNKVTSLSASSTDTQYPSAKCVYDLIGDVETILATLTTP